MPKQFFFWAAIFWTGVITFFCLAQFQFNSIPFQGVSNLDKYVHAFFYFVLTTLWFFYFKKQLKNVSIVKPLLISFLISIFYGIAIEILQAIATNTRKADVYDVLANTTGAIIAVVLILWLNKKTFLEKIE